MVSYRVAALAGAALIVAGCQTANVQNKENLLAAAGFQFRPADTPAKLAALQALPPHKFVQKVQNGQPVWLYADPTICKCLYVGNQSAWQAYRQMVFQQNIASEQQMTALINQQSAFDFGVWGPEPWVF
jgi:hypothetical protein